MRQVPRNAGRPAHHLLIGSGRVFRHFERYLSLLGLSFETWNRPRALSRELFSNPKTTHLWILVSDSAIEPVAREIEAGLREFAPEREAHLLHASGALVTEHARGVHPLMTFGKSLYELETYRRIPFVIEDRHDGVPPEAILGGIPNVTVPLDAEMKPMYHALVSVAGNFPSLLWAEVFTKFENDLGLPRDLLAPFLFQSLSNVLRSGSDAVTGPLIRGDRATIRKHKLALEGSRFVPLYEAFEAFFSSAGGEDVKPHS